MKKLSFALALALICITMFSCGEKSVVNPLSDDFKITTFSPVSGLIGSKVTLFGQNLDQDSIISVTFGDQTAEILTRSSDSVIVKVPEIAVGFYDITVKTKTKSYVYDKQYEVLIKMGITTFFPASGYINTKVSLFGENLDKDSVISVQFGNQNAEILSYSKDSILVKVPNILTGKYDIIVKTKTNSYLYDTKYEVLALDFSQYKNFTFNIYGLRIKFNYHHYFWESVGGSGSYDNQIIRDPYSYKLSNTFPLNYEKVGNNSYLLSEINSVNTNNIQNSIKINIDESYNIIKTMELKFYNSAEQFKTNEQSYTTFSLSLKLINVEIYLSNDSIITIKLLKNDIINKMKNFSTGSFDRFETLRSHLRKDETTMSLKEFLGINDDAYIEIKFTK